MSIYAETTMSTMPGSCTECKLGERYGFVGDVKCRILREYFTGNVEPPYKERPDECPLVEMTTPSNSPLTLDELRGMDGEPVWISPVKGKGKVLARWMLVSGYNPNKDIYLFAPPSNITQGYDGKSYGKTWLAYRRKPEPPKIESIGDCGCTGKPCSECQPGPCEHRRQEVN